MTARVLKPPLLFILISLPVLLLAQLPQAKKVKFPTGKSAIKINAVLNGDQVIDYKVDVKPDQKLIVSLKTKSTNTYFNVMEPGEKNVAIYNGSINGNNYSGNVSKPGEYTIRVYQMRKAARRGNRVEYEITIAAE